MATFITTTPQAAVEGDKQKYRYTITTPAYPTVLNEYQGFGLSLDGDLVQFLAPFGGATHEEMYTGFANAVAQEKINNPTGKWAGYDFTVTDNGTSIDIESKYSGLDPIQGNLSINTFNFVTLTRSTIQAFSQGTPQINNITPQGAAIGDHFSVTMGSTTLTVVANTPDDTAIVAGMVNLINDKRNLEPNGDFGFPLPYGGFSQVDGVVAINEGTYIKLVGISKDFLPETLSIGVGFTQTSSVFTPVTGDVEDTANVLAGAETELACQLHKVCKEEVFGIKSKIDRKEMIKGYMAFRAVRDGDIANDTTTDCLVSALNNL